MRNCLGTASCKICLEEKSVEHFHFRNDSQKYRSECKECWAKSRMTHYYDNHTTHKERAKKKRSHRPAELLLTHAKSSAKTRGLDFNLELSDILIPEICPYLGIPLTNIQGMGYIYSNMSVDRIDSSKGYIKGNIQIISRKANSMKNDATEQELLTFAQSILRKHHGSSSSN